MTQFGRHRFADVEPHRIHQLDRPHGHAEGDRRRIEQFLAFPALHAFDRAEHVGHENPVHEEPRRRLDHHRRLADGQRKRCTLADFGIAVEARADHFDQRQLRHRVEEMQPDQPRRIFQPFGNAFKFDRGCVGSEDCAWLQPVFQPAKYLLLDG